MKSESWLIAELAVALMVLGMASFFFQPAYEKGVWAIVTGFLTAMGTVMGYKFGKSMPQQAGETKQDPKP